MSSYKVRNYNMSYEQLLDAVNEFEGFITGGGVNNQLFAYGFGENVFGEKMMRATDKEVSKRDEFIKDISSRILDRTTGTYFMSYIMGGVAVKVADWSPLDHKGLIEFCYLDQQLKAPFLKHTHDIFNPQFYTSDLGSHLATAPASIRETVAGLDPSTLKRQSVPEETEDKQKEKNTDKKKTKFVVPFPPKGNRERLVSTSPIRPVVNDPAAIKCKDGKVEGEPDRYLAPSLAAIVCKYSKLNFSGRKAQHLSVFFNGVTPLEMSRCSPFLNLTVMTERLNKQDNTPNMNNVSYWNFVKTHDNTFSLNDGIGLSVTKPLQSEGNEALTDLIDAGLTTDYSYMDIFTSPQMAANANVNGKAFSGKSLSEIGKNLTDATINTTPVLDPIQPMLSISDFTVAISGNGHGMMASKTAKLSLVLHDRSRLKDLAPLLSSDKFSSTKIMLEYGWTHPDGGAASNNTIGRYLDALRDTGIFTVRGVDYSFSGGTAVNIDVKLTCSGFNESKTIPAAAGDKVPLFMIKDYVDKKVNDIVSGQKKAINKEKFPEVRSILKSRQRNAKSPTNLIPHENFKKFISKIRKMKSQKGPERKVLLEDISNDIASIVFGITDPDKAAKAWDKMAEATAKDKADASSAEILFSKVYATRQNTGPDPFVGCFITECKATKEKTSVDKPIEMKDVFPAHCELVRVSPPEGPPKVPHVTLGKLCMMFIGHPLSTCGLYDEVQVVFYPMNHQAAGARKHTTASFPINQEKLETAFLEHIEQTSRLSVHGAFRIFEKLVRDRSGAVYGFDNAHEELDKYKKKSTEDRQKDAEAWAKKKGWDITKFKPKEILESYQEELVSRQKGDIGSALEKIYGKKPELPSSDGVEFAAEDKFVVPNISLFFEVIPVVDSKASDAQSAIFNGVKDSYRKAFAKDDVNQTQSNGLKPDRSILRVHIYDEESVSSPSTMSMSSVLYEGQTGYLLGNNSGEPTQDVEDAVKATVVGLAPDGTEEIEYEVTKAIEAMPFGQVKQFVKRAFPSITYGAGTGTINSIQVSGNTSGQLANVVMVEAYGNKLKGQTAQSEDDNFEEMIMFPGSISINMMGMPLISRGENIFVDFGTDTSLDNIYVVKSVMHRIGSGEFTTNLELVNANQGAIRSFRKTMLKKTAEMLEGE